MREITPSSVLGEAIVTLLRKPQAPVGRDFLDRILNRKRNPVLNTVLGDTLVWLHLEQRIQREFRQPHTHEDCAETQMVFWIEGVDYDGYANVKPDFSKFKIAEMVEDIRIVHGAAEMVKPQPALVVGAEVEFESDEPQAETAPESETEIEVVQEPLAVSPAPAPVSPPISVPVQNPAHTPSPLTGVRQTTDQRIAAWARLETKPWTKKECNEYLEGDFKITAMRISHMVSKGALQQGAFRGTHCFLHPVLEHPEFDTTLKGIQAYQKIVVESKPSRTGLALTAMVKPAAAAIEEPSADSVRMPAPAPVASPAPEPAPTPTPAPVCVAKESGVSIELRPMEEFDFSYKAQPTVQAPSLEPKQSKEEPFPFVTEAKTRPEYDVQIEVRNIKQDEPHPPLLDAEDTEFLLSSKGYLVITGGNQNLTLGPKTLKSLLAFLRQTQPQ